MLCMQFNRINSDWFDLVFLSSRDECQFQPIAIQSDPMENCIQRFEMGSTFYNKLIQRFFCQSSSFVFHVIFITTFQRT